jgi:hypothetical protein
MRRWHLSALVLIAASAYAANAQAWTPNSAQIAKLEASVKLEQLPNWKTQHLPSLTGYARYYTGSTQGGEQVILGELNVPFGSREQPGVHIVKNESGFPSIYDGGCAIIHLVYSVKQQKVVSIGCNGFA